MIKVEPILRARLAVLGVSLALLTACSPAPPPAPSNTSRLQVSVSPSASTIDQVVHLRVTGLTPAEMTTIDITSTDGAGVTWTSHADYRSTSQGTVDTSSSAAMNGTYTGTLGMGLLASMQPSLSPAGYRWPKTPASFDITAHAAGKTATATFTRSLTRPGSSIDYAQPTVAQNGFSGFYATTAAEETRRHPAVLLIGGSEGGNDQQVAAAALTLHAMSALSIAYFKSSGLPATLSKIPLEYFARALIWLRSQPGVDADRVWVMGTSRGSEAAQLLAIHYPQLVHGVIASSPSNTSNCSYPTGNPPCVGPAWTYHGTPLPYTEDFNNPSPSDNAAAVLPDERITGPVLVVCGGADQVWRSCLLGQAILDRRKAHHVTFTDHLYSYPKAGHGIGNLLPYNITTPQPTLQGLTPTDDYAALGDLWPRMIAALSSD